MGGGNSVPESDSLPLGNQQGDYASELYLGYVNTAWGTIPSKIGRDKPSANYISWYSYGGKEYKTTSFQYVRGDINRVYFEKFFPNAPVPENALSSGYQGRERMYHIIAVMKAGYYIPGKSNSRQCWYGYDGSEHATTADCYYVCMEPTSNYGTGLFVSAGPDRLPRTSHKGRWLGVGVIVYALGTLLYCVPQWLSDPYEFAGFQKGNSSPAAHEMGANSPSRYCIPRTGNSTCDDVLSELPNFKSPVDYAFYIFVGAAILRGIGSSPLFVLGTTYLDENVSQKRSPKLLGFEMLGAGMGPIFGAIFAAICLRVYGDIDKNIDTERILEQINPDDPRWYGAWWIGYLAAGMLGLFVAIPILGFARKLPNADEERKHDVSMELKTKASNQAAQSLKQLPMAVINLFRNYCFVLICAAQVCMSMAFASLILFGPKLIEDLFNRNSSDALLISALTIVIPASIGMAAGGTLISKLKLRCKALFRYCAVCLILATPLMAVSMLYCDPQPVAGVISIDYHNNPLSPGSPKILTDSCNSNCSCSSTGFQPVCDKISGITYYSPCHAGCLNPVTEKKASIINTKWTNCTCLDQNSNGKTMTSSAPVVESGLCTSKCWRLYLFIGLMILKGGLMGMKFPAMQQGQLRVVSVEQRTMALSVAWIITRVLGTIPGQQIMGAILDSACEYDGEDSTSGDTCPAGKMPKFPMGPARKPGPKCVRYNSRKLAVSVSVYGVILNLVGAFFYLLASCVYKPAAEVTKNGTKLKKGSSDKIAPIEPSPQVVNVDMEL